MQNVSTMDIPDFVQLGGARRAKKAGGRRTTRGSSSESSASSSVSSSPANSPRGPPQHLAHSYLAARQGMAGLCVEADLASTEREKGLRFGHVCDDGGGMESDMADKPADCCGGQQSQRMTQKQIEFDGDGWEDVGDSGDDMDAKLFGQVGKGEDDYYDPDMDDLDQQFVDNRRLRHMGLLGRSLRPTPKPPKRRNAATHRTTPPKTPPVYKEGRMADMTADMTADMADSSDSMPLKADSSDSMPASAGRIPPSLSQQTAPAVASHHDSNMQQDQGAEETKMHLGQDEGGTETSGGEPTSAAQDSRGECKSGNERPACTAQDTWKAYVAATGHAYYHNSRTGESSWIKPEGFEGDGAAIKGPATRTDALLSCACCFAIVCLDCQRHAKYLHQYRAMFVQNCQVLRTERLRVAPPALVAESCEGGGEAFLYPVRCKTCQAEIAVMDQDEIFHFFDVIPSNG